MVVLLLAALLPFAAARPLAASAIAFSDGFEDGSLAAWTVHTTGGGTAANQAALVATGSRAARLAASGSTSSAYMRAALTPALSDVTAALDVNVVAEGANRDVVPLIRLFSSAGTRLVSVDRLNSKSNKVLVQIGSSTFSTGGKLALERWATVTVDVQATGSTSSVTLRLDGATIYAGTGLALDGSIAWIQVGSEVPGQAFEIAADTVSVTANDSLPTPTPTPTPTPDPSPTPTPTPDPSPTPAPDPSPTAPPPGGVLFSDDFESGAVSSWSQVRTGGTGFAVAQGAVVAGGAWAARIAASGTGSYAYLRQALAVAQTDITVGASVDVIAEGASGGNVPLIRLFDASGARLVSLYRQNVAGDKVYIQHSGAYTTTTGILPLGRWANVEVRVIVGGTGASTVEARLDGVLIHRTTTASIAGQVAFLQVGNDTANQAFDIAVDDVTAITGSPGADAPDTTIDSGPSGTVASSTAAFTFSSSKAGSTFGCRLDGGTWAACTSPHTLSGLSNATHIFEVRAIDAAGVIDPTPASRTWTVNVTTACDPSLPAPATTDPGTVVVADNFEDGLGKWTRVVVQGDAAVGTQTTNVKSGRCASRVHVTDNTWDSRGNLIKTLPSGTNEIWISGWFNTEVQGESSAWNTPTFRVLTNGKRIFDISRQNQTSSLFVRFPSKTAGQWTIFGTGRLMQLNRWYHVRVHLIANDHLSTVEAWLDGSLVYRSTQATLGVNRLDVVMVGAEHQGQAGDIAVDDVVVKASVPATPPPVFADDFEQGLVAWDAVVSGGDGSVTAETGLVRSGSGAARLRATTASGSLAYLQNELNQSENDLTVALDIYVVAEGSSSTYLPVIVLLDQAGGSQATVWRRSQSGTLTVQYAGVSYDVGGTIPAGRWVRVELQAIGRAGATGTVILLVDGALAYRSDTAAIGVFGTRAFRVGNSSASKAFEWVVDNVTATRGTAGYQDDAGYKLLIADHLSRRLLITDFSGRVVWKWDNPTGRTESDAGPIGVRWMSGNRILATFGTGEVGLIDVAGKRFIWKVSGFNGDWFQSPYDAEILPDGNLAVALRFNNGGRISVFDLATGTEIWKHYLSNAHAVHFRTAAQSYNSEDPTLLVGGWGSVREVAYRTNGGQNVTWQVQTEFTHDVMVVEDDQLLTTEGYYIQKINRTGTKLWRRPTPDENRRIAVNPNAGGGYVYTVAESDRVEIRDLNGYLIRDWSMLSDGTGLDYPYGVQVIEYPG